MEWILIEPLIRCRPLRKVKRVRIVQLECCDDFTHGRFLNRWVLERIDFKFSRGEELFKLPNFFELISSEFQLPLKRGINAHSCPYLSIHLTTVINPTLLPDLFILASKLRDPYYLGYFSALDYWGVAPILYHVCVVVVQKTDKFTTFRVPKKNPRYSILATTTKDFKHGVRHVRYREKTIKVSSPARTLIEIIDRPHLAGGWAEVIRALDSLVLDLKSEDLQEVAELLQLEAFHKKSLAARIGYILKLLPSLDPCLPH